MNKGLGAFIFFALGAAVGAAVTWKLTARRADELARSEIESVKAAYSKRETTKAETSEKPDIMSFYAECAKKETDGCVAKNKIRGQKAEKNDISIIPPDEFGDESDYEQVYITLYTDGVLAYDENDEEIVTNPNDILGEGALSEMGKFEPDCLHIRNDERKTYYEIVCSDRDFYEKGHGE